MEHVYKSYSEKYTDNDVRKLSGLVAQVSLSRLLPFIQEAIGLKSNETIVGIDISTHGVKCYIETEYEAR